MVSHQFEGALILSQLQCSGRSKRQYSTQKDRDLKVSLKKALVPRVQDMLSYMYLDLLYCSFFSFLQYVFPNIS